MDDDPAGMKHSVFDKTAQVLLANRAPFLTGNFS
jgi:hypothetical protein